MGWDEMWCGVSELFVSEFKVVIVLPSVSHLSAHDAHEATLLYPSLPCYCR